MTPRRPPLPPEAALFRRRLLAAMMTVIAAIAAATMFAVRRGIAAAEEQRFEVEFQGALAAMEHVQDLRRAALLERCRALARKARIVSALEDDALDLLYLSARDELRDAVRAPENIVAPTEGAGQPLRARFYRFLDRRGAVLPPPPGDDACGALTPEEERQLALPGLGFDPQLGCIAGSRGAADSVELGEIIATPILASETGEPIAALVMGFAPVRSMPSTDGLAPFASGLWLEPHLHAPTLAPPDRPALAAGLREAIATAGASTEPLHRFLLDRGGIPQRVFFKQLNPGSRYPAAHEFSVFSLGDMLARQRRAAWQIAGAGAVLLLAGWLASRQLATRFTKPVAALALDSAEQRMERRRAEAALESTSAELERVARFSADASHQLKTPVTVLRAGLGEMLARGAIPAEEAEEVASLIHQTFRLSTVIEDLLLLSRLDAGQLKINFTTVDLARLIEASLDDLSAAPDELDLAIESDFPPSLSVAGEKRYLALILQNLLENAQKYNRPGGRIRIVACAAAGAITLTIGNTTRRPIPPEAQPNIFERFHRGAMGENIPGYGIGLNLARELARLHDGDLRLIRSDEAWTEFELRFRAPPPVGANAS